jgi:double-strand break repair protein MRE11
MTQLSQKADDNSLFKIMIATDNHLGFLENDQTRGDDSFVSFEEILKTSKYEKVDFLLLGGDLFHHHNPSKKTM